MISIKPLSTALALMVASGVTPAAAQGVQYCDVATGVCYSQVETNGISYGVAIPAATAPPFDILLQVVAPTSIGWAGIAWGGGMHGNPLTVGWANGASTVVSSRWATAHTLPDVYDGATYQVLKGSTSNSTHWTLNVLCTGCSQWVEDGETDQVDPDSTSATLGFAAAETPPTNPSDTGSTFTVHTHYGGFSFDMSLAQSEDFDAYVASLTE
ncbi:hypothetical protein F4778DRAFT_772208 [Xylariomycetidae sp. FL2044]|nr:hypothetical protein F4778DRAFT_772208 [Xylariomycetidae sp. FL2044]